MVIYKHDKENKIGRETVQHVLQLFFCFNSDSSAPALIYFWWYKQDDFAVWYIQIWIFKIKIIIKEAAE